MFMFSGSSFAVSIHQDDKKIAEQKREPLPEEPAQGKEAKLRQPPDGESGFQKKARTATTPTTLKQLLPEQGNRSSEVWILRNPGTYGYQIRYPTGHLEQNQESETSNQFIQLNNA